MAYEGKLASVTALANGGVAIKTFGGTYGQVLEEGNQEFSDVAGFLDALESKEQALGDCLPWIPLILEKHKNPGNVNALFALAGKRAVFDTDPGQTVLSFPA